MDWASRRLTTDVETGPVLLDGLVDGSADQSQRVVIWGSSGHARVVAAVLRLDPRYVLSGFIDDVDPERHGASFCESRVLGGRDVLASLVRDGCRYVFLGFGANGVRLALSRELEAEYAISFPTLVHPRAWVDESATLGRGVLVGAGAIVNAGACVGDHAIINTAAVVEHDVQVGAGAHIGPNSCLAGGVVVRATAWVGASAVVRERLTVSEGATVGMGAVVTRDVASGSVVVGCPARPLAPASVDSRP